MDMSGMDMSMGGDGLFRTPNKKIAIGLWYGIAGCVGILTLKRVIEYHEARRQHNLKHDAASSVPLRPRNGLAQSYATMTAISRELAYPQPLYFTGRFSRYFSPLPVGRWIVLVVYWTVLLCMLWSDTILSPDDSMYGYKWEKVGFRAAWVSVAQIPFIYLLSCKLNPISILTGVSYERFNWLHRWAARTVFLTVIVHWSFFFREWVLADFVKLELEMMPMVKYGFGAWAVIGWMVLSGFGFFRDLCYELFVLQHICAAATLLWLLYVHVPVHARYHIYMSIGFVAFDSFGRIVWGFLQNTHLLARPTRMPGYEARLESLAGDRVRIVLDDADFTWKPGQHVYLSIPRLRPFEVHPFTIANNSTSETNSTLNELASRARWSYSLLSSQTFAKKGPGGSSVARSSHRSRLTMIVKAHSGFSRSLQKAASKSGPKHRTYRAFLSGPWGHPPRLSHYDTIVLIACSTGASFILPLLHDLVRKPMCVRSVTLHWIIRDDNHLTWYEKELNSLQDIVREGSLQLRMFVHVTNLSQEPDHGSFATPKAEEDTLMADSSSEDASNSGSLASVESSDANATLNRHRGKKCSSVSVQKRGRPSVESMVRPPVEAALGETAVVVCGGLSISAQTRTFVAALSDEKAVHKGSGAQGIFLFTETYGW